MRNFIISLIGNVAGTAAMYFYAYHSIETAVFGFLIGMTLSWFSLTALDVIFS